MYTCMTILILLAASREIESLECYSCSGIANVDECRVTSLCSTGQACFTNQVTTGQDTTYTLGCTNNQQCGVQSNSQSEIVGREIRERETSCHECCSTERCNNQLCIHFKPTTCIDDTKVDCAYLNAMFNICKDIQHSKTVCPKFCGLCKLVDGNWAQWSQWSSCDVTCETGIQTRTRSCTDPAPANKGLDCVGNNTETKSCIKQPCPIHGGWSLWSDWGGCSVTCDVGIQKRYRNCSNPFPSRFGDHCFGDPMDDKLCKPGPCANGGWSLWGNWSTCSVSCDGGLHSRFRDCTNPVPSALGMFCRGQSTQVEECNKTPCVLNVAFNVNTLASKSPTTGSLLRFTNAILNAGNGYNTTTGKFTAPVQGTYLFSVHVCQVGGRYFDVSIVVNNTDYAVTALRDGSYNNCGSASTSAVLNKADQVWIKCKYYSTSNVVSQDSNFINTFTGTLIR